jgi:hypothetical protein
MLSRVDFDSEGFIWSTQTDTIGTVLDIEDTNINHNRNMFYLNDGYLYVQCASSIYKIDNDTGQVIWWVPFSDHSASHLYNTNGPLFVDNIDPTRLYIFYSVGTSGTSSGVTVYVTTIRDGVIVSRSILAVPRPWGEMQSARVIDDQLYWTYKSVGIGSSDRGFTMQLGDDPSSTLSFRTISATRFTHILENGNIVSAIEAQARYKKFYITDIDGNVIYSGGDGVSMSGNLLYSESWIVDERNLIVVGEWDTGFVQMVFGYDLDATDKIFIIQWAEEALTRLLNVRENGDVYITRGTKEMIKIPNYSIDRAAGTSKSIWDRRYIHPARGPYY